MYSPKISEVLIPTLYRMARSQGVPMTTLVNRVIATEVRKFNRKEKTNAGNDNTQGRRNSAEG